MPHIPTAPRNNTSTSLTLPSTQSFTAVLAQWLGIARPPRLLAASQMSTADMDGVLCAAHLSLPSQTPTTDRGVSLLSLPDELIGLCLVSLDALDLVHLEQVSRRLCAVVQGDSLRWRQVVQDRWPAPLTNQYILAQAAVLAGGWKPLYAEKHVWDRTRAPWTVPSQSEARAFIDLVKLPLAPAIEKPMAHSPTSVVSQADPLRRDAAPDDMDHMGMAVAVLVDGSSSVTEEDFSAMKAFSASFLDSLAATHPQSTACLIQFNQYPRVEQALVPVADGTPKNAVLRMEQMMGSTDIAAPIRRAHETLAAADLSTHRDRIILMLTDGQTHAEELRLCERQVSAVAEELGTRVFTIGVGRDVDQTGLERIAMAAHRNIPIHSSALHSCPPETKGCYFTLRRLKK